jgi:hypothetical protein
VPGVLRGFHCGRKLYVGYGGKAGSKPAELLVAALRLAHALDIQST